jgi:hypothetical protein
MVRGGIRPEEGFRGVRGRGKIDGDGVAGQRSAGDRVGRKKFGDREAGEPQQVPSGTRAIVVANDFDSHVLVGRASACLLCVWSYRKLNPDRLKPVLPYKRQQRRARPAHDLQKRDRVARVEARAGGGVLHPGGVPRRGYNLNAARRNRVLRRRSQCECADRQTPNS